MSSLLGNELKSFPWYKTDLFDRRGEIRVMEDGLVFDSGGMRTEVPKDMVESVKVIRELPFAKCLVNLSYFNYTGSTVNVSIIVSEEDYSFIVSKLKK